MAKGKLTAEEMFEKLVGSPNRPTKADTIKCMREFAKQEVSWWSRLCDRWEKAYNGLIKDIGE